MKSYLKQYKPFLLFILKFGLAYLVLTLVYERYLAIYENQGNQIDSITQAVASQTQAVLTGFGKKATTHIELESASIQLLYKNKHVASIIEGCNGISVIILFITFVFAFTGKTKQTLLFIFFGSVFIYVLNLLRIAILTVALYHYPEYENIMHRVLFPAFIYGVIFILWIVWVNYFSIYATKNPTT